MSAIFSRFIIIKQMLLPFGMIVSKLAAPIPRIKEAYMLVMISLLCTVGVYFVRGNPFDLLFMAPLVISPTLAAVLVVIVFAMLSLPLIRLFRTKGTTA